MASEPAKAKKRKVVATQPAKGSKKSKPTDIIGKQKGIKKPAEKEVAGPTKQTQKTPTTPANQGNAPRTHTALVTKDIVDDCTEKTTGTRQHDSLSPDTSSPKQLEPKFPKRSAQLAEDSKKDQIAFFRETVRTELFKKVKFITHERMLEYGHVVSKTVLKALELGRDEAVKELYWNAYSGYVNKALNDKRGNVNNEMKKAFLGTYNLDTQHQHTHLLG